MQTTETPPDPHPLIPAPALVRDRLARLRVEVRLLARLLHLSEELSRATPRRTPDHTGVPRVA